jgi:LysR substrate binding domain
VSGNLRSNSALELRLAAALGQGIYLTPRFLVAEELRSGRLCTVLDDFLTTEHAIIASYPHRHHLSAKVRAFIDLLAEYCRAETSRPALLPVAARRSNASEPHALASAPELQPSGKRALPIAWKVVN